MTGSHWHNYWHLNTHTHIHTHTHTLTLTQPHYTNIHAKNTSTQRANTRADTRWDVGTWSHTVSVCPVTRRHTVRPREAGAADTG